MNFWICDKCGAEVDSTLPMSYTSHQKVCSALKVPEETVGPKTHELQLQEEQRLRRKAKPFDPIWLKMTSEEKQAMIKAFFDEDETIAEAIKKEMQNKYPN